MAELMKCRCGGDPVALQTSTGWYKVKCPACRASTEKCVCEMQAENAWEESSCT